MSTLRISGGALRGRRIPLPPTDLRPTSAVAREAFFNVVAPLVEGCAFLDLFSGSGIFSFEAASRGAARIVAVDSSPRSLRTLGSLAREWNLSITTMPIDALQAVKRLAPGEPFDLVWADPPYAYERYPALLEALDRDLPLSDDAVVALEHRSGALPFDPASLTRLAFRKTARYGTVSVTYLDRIAA